MKLIEKIKTGDVIYCTCVDVPLCYHLGIVHEKNNKKIVYHNSPYNKNKYGGSVCVETYEDFVKNREVIKIIRTGVGAERILKVSKKCKSDIWDTFLFNCEDYILEVVENHRRSDVRDAYKIAALGILILYFID